MYGRATTHTPSCRPTGLPVMVVAAVLLMGLVEAGAQPACLPEVGEIYLCDPLDDGVTVAERHGGTFVADGWLLGGFGEYLMYDTASPIGSGQLSFYVRGIESDAMPVSNGAKFHMLEVFDHAGHGEAFYLLAIRTWGQAHADWHEHLKFFYKTLEPAPEDCGSEVYTTTPVVSWDPDHWYHFDVTFEGGLAVMRVDGVELLSVEYGDCPIVLQQIYLPLQPWVEGALDCIDGSIYSHVSLNACPDPCDDHNECTADDRCEAYTCIGTAVEDGTECDDGDPHTTGDQCLQGECTGTPPEEGDDDDSADAPADDAEPPGGGSDDEPGGCGCADASHWQGSQTMALLVLGGLFSRRRGGP
jgi:hypothetical protein